MKYAVRRRVNYFALLAGLAISLETGCRIFESERSQLENVTKDWFQLIRASHIYPIYPLSEDLAPGDVFICPNEVEDLTEWQKAGYVRLDHLIHRLYPTNYGSFYLNSFFTDTNNLPRHWIKDNSWTNAPLAAFPSYSFTVKQGGSGNVALPIQGIPMALGLMGAKDASGHVTIADAHTYGIDEISLLAQLEQFVNAQRTNVLAVMRVQYDGKTNYFLRVISRVYVTQKVAVSMFNDAAFGGTISAGAVQDISAPNLQNTNAVANYTNWISAVNGVISGFKTATGAPGGAVKFTAVSSRSVAIEETFPRPLVIGYTALNVLVRKDALESPTANRIILKAVPEASVIKMIRNPKFTGKTIQDRVNALLAAVDKLSDADAINLAKDPPGREMEKMVAARDPDTRRNTDGQVARDILKMRLVQDDNRTEQRLSQWETAVNSKK